MPLLTGLDEAGYGPKLGPLAVGLSAFEVPEGLLGADLWAVLAPAVARRLRGRVAPGGAVEVDDSKALYRRPSDIGRLARGVAAFRALGPEAADGAPAEGRPYYGAPDDPLGGAIDAPALTALRQALARMGVRPVFLGARLVFEEAFNARLGEPPSKGRVLAGFAAEFVRCTTAPDRKACAHGSISPLSRRERGAGGGEGRFLFGVQGGRTDYRSFLADAFPGVAWERLPPQRDAAGRRRHPYRSPLGCAEFVEDGDASELPISLASMAAKLARERAMERLNAFWAARVPGLRRTGGYPNDEPRFLLDIAGALAASGLFAEGVRRRR